MKRPFKFQRERLDLTYAEQYRVAKILEIISRKNAFPTYRKLMEEIGGSLSTIRRAVEYMIDTMGLPIARRPAGGFYLTEKVKPIPIAKVTESEVQVMHFGKSGEQSLRNTGLDEKFRSVYKKVNAGLNRKITGTIGDWTQIISFHSSFEPIMNPELFPVLVEAAAHFEQLKIRYLKPGPDQVIEDRIIDIYQMANINGEWYIMVWDHGRNDERTFIPARVKSIAKTGKTFKRPKDWTVEERLKHSFVIETGKGSYDLVIHFNEHAADYIREKKWKGQTKIVELPNGHLDLHMTLSTLKEVQRWIMTFNGNAFPIGPKELCDLYYAGAEKMLSNRKLVHI